MKKLLIASSLILLVAAGCNKIQKDNNADSSMNTGSVDTANTNGSMTAMHHDSSGSNTTPIQSHRTYSLNILSGLDSVKPGQPTTIKFNIKDEKGDILKDFQLEHTKLLHFVVVRKDLQQFQHIHPDFNKATGEFTIAVTFPTDGPYRVFADFTPQGAQMGEGAMALGVSVNQDLTVGDVNKYKAVALTPDTNILKIVDGYRINYQFPTNIKSQTPVDYGLIIEKDNQKVQLEDYLGAKGHSIILKEGAEDYIHNHANGAMQGMDMSGNNDMQMTGDGVDFSTSFPEPGIYKIFTQFQVKGKVITSDYTVKVK
jgi:hypothetical protein